MLFDKIVLFIDHYARIIYTNSSLHLNISYVWKTVNFLYYVLIGVILVILVIWVAICELFNIPVKAMALYFYTALHSWKI